MAAHAALELDRTVTGSELSVCALVATLTLFILFQSYGNSWPQSRQTTYVPVTDAAALRRSLPLTVIGKLQRLCQHPKSRLNILISFLLAPSGAVLNPFSRARIY